MSIIGDSYKERLNRIIEELEGLAEVNSNINIGVSSGYTYSARKLREEFNLYKIVSIEESR